MEVRCNPSLNTKCSCGEAGREGERQGGREDADNRSQGQTGRLIRRKGGGACMCVCVCVCVCVCICFECQRGGLINDIYK